MVWEYKAQFRRSTDADLEILQITVHRLTRLADCACACACVSTQEHFRFRQPITLQSSAVHSLMTSSLQMVLNSWVTTTQATAAGTFTRRRSPAAAVRHRQAGPRTRSAVRRNGASRRRLQGRRSAVTALDRTGPGDPGRTRFDVAFAYGIRDEHEDFTPGFSRGRPVVSTAKLISPRVVHRCFERSQIGRFETTNSTKNGQQLVILVLTCVE